jgi:ABC-2 type transport system permease protein
VKLLHVALKDLRRSFRSAFLLVSGLGIPLLVTGLFYFAFGGLAAGDGGFELPVTRVQVVNLDQPSPQSRGFSAGQALVDLLQGEELAGLLQVTVATDESHVRAAVDGQEAGVGVIIPPDFTAAALDPDRHVAVEVYGDPTLTLGPRIVESVVSQFVDGFAGSQIAVDVVYDQLSETQAVADASVLQSVALRYADWATALGERQRRGADALLDVRSPHAAPVEEDGSEGMATIVAMMMAAMMVLYLFFIAAASAQSILQEEEAGTLARLFTTPTPQSVILGGKVVAGLVTLVVQVVALVLMSSLVFGIDWGEPLPLVLVSLALVLLAASFGLFVTSLLKNTRQSGIVYGGVMTVAGMLGMIGIFTPMAPGASGAMATIALLVPQGWSVRGWQILLQGGGVSDVVGTVGVQLALGVVFFVLGVSRFRKRFA